MNVASWIVGLILVAVFAFAGGTKIVDLDRMRERFGYTAGQYRLIGLTEVAAAVAIVVGLVWRQIEWLAVAAGVGICALMVGAVLTHARVEDSGRETLPAGAMFVLSIVFMVLISLR